MEKYTRLVLSGGGAKGLALLGALHYVCENHGLDNFQEYWGVSVGSIIIFLLQLGYTPFDCFYRYFILEDFVNESHLPNILQNSAVFPVQIISEQLMPFVREKLGNINPTFADMYRITGKKLHIVGTNTTTMTGKIFNVDNTPDMNVLDAIEISSCLPGVFTRKEYNGEIYVDGGFINNYPIDLADDDINYTLGICVWGDFNVMADNYIGWIYRLLHIPILELHRLRVSLLSNKCTNVELQISNISLIDIVPSQKKKMDIFTEGYRQMDEFLKDKMIIELANDMSTL